MQKPPRAGQAVQPTWEPLGALEAGWKDSDLTSASVAGCSRSRLPYWENPSSFCWGRELPIRTLQTFIFGGMGGVHATVLVRCVSALEAKAWKKYPFLCYMPCSLPAPLHPALLLFFSCAYFNSNSLNLADKSGLCWVQEYLYNGMLESGSTVWVVRIVSSLILLYRWFKERCLWIV